MNSTYVCQSSKTQARIQQAITYQTDSIVDSPHNKNFLKLSFHFSIYFFVKYDKLSLEYTNCELYALWQEADTGY